MRQRAEDALLSGVFDVAQYRSAVERLTAEQQRLEHAWADLNDRSALVPTRVEADQLMVEVSAAIRTLSAGRYCS